jgi:hypothetical protein
LRANILDTFDEGVILSEFAARIVDGNGARFRADVMSDGRTVDWVFLSSAEVELLASRLGLGSGTVTVPVKDLTWFIEEAATRSNTNGSRLTFASTLSSYLN